MRSLKRPLVVVATTAAVLVGTAGTAQAGTDRVATGPGAKVTFTSYGDSFKVCDTETDGLTVYNEYKYIRKDGTVQHDYEYNGLGNGTCATYDHNFGEGRSVTFRACADLPGPLPDPCSAWVVGIA
ncbi:hypothetical protein [Micromonospora sp. NBC_01638]|uniref:hypothetical protein n=1 Tax=Micromonospora sp. NBC_01638 TaxID=2975982 RepID=UPI00386555B8|nr:hypothetical protein OG811_29500 [Micromonospora sp. NBC_01638]